jgi:hypothetical protein
MDIETIINASRNLRPKTVTMAGPAPAPAQVKLFAINVKGSFKVSEFKTIPSKWLKLESREILGNPALGL